MKSGTFPLAVNHKREDDYTRQLGANSRGIIEPWRKTIVREQAEEENQSHGANSGGKA
jgi:hypothetical protein